PNNAAAMNNLGVALQHRRKHLDALAAYAKASRANPHDPLPRRNATRLARGARRIGLVVVVWIVVSNLLNSTQGGANSDVKSGHPWLALAAVLVVIGLFAGISFWR